MAELENLKRFLNEPVQDKDAMDKSSNDNDSVDAYPNQDEINKNTEMSSLASRVCEKIKYVFTLISIGLLLLCIFKNDHFFGAGIKDMKLWDLIKLDSDTIIANLMVRSAFMAFYMVFVELLVDKITCRVCGNFFTGRNKIWSKYRGMDTERTTTTTIDGAISQIDVDETYNHHYLSLYQCKNCANIYLDHETKTTHSHERSYY